MKVSLYCLNELIDLKDFFSQPEKLADVLSLAGLEVEGWENYSNGYHNVLIGRVEQKKRLEKSDRLNLCQVRVSETQVRQVVCGADNFKVGDLVPLALPPNDILCQKRGNCRISIEKRKLMGVSSEGMILSFGELFPSPIAQNLQSAIKQEVNVIVLSSSAIMGELFANYICLNDIIFDLNITPNRADCLSHLGIARELSCLLNRKIINSKPIFSTPPAKLNPIKYEDCFQQNMVQVRQSQQCLRYTGSVLYGVKIDSSPLWLRVRLILLGFKPINNIVDATNYLMIHQGQPLHAFDWDRLSSQKIIIDCSQKGEQFKILDGNELQLTGQELCIRDTKGPIALAGVMGGLNSSVHKDTQNVFIESACFDSNCVRQTSMRFHIESESAYRFSRGVPVESVKSSLKTALIFMQKLSGGLISQNLKDFWPNRNTQIAISINQQDLEKRLGMPVIFKNFQKKMQQMGCIIQNQKLSQSSTCLVEPPFFRMDLQIKEDLIEEYARLEGYHQIPEKIISAAPEMITSSEKKIAEKKDAYFLNSHLSQLLCQEGFYEAINHDFISKEFSYTFLTNDQKPLKGNLCMLFDGVSIPSYLTHEQSKTKPSTFGVLVHNPLSAEYNMMRVSFVPSLFRNAEQNLRRGHGVSLDKEGRLFELGAIFSRSEEKNTYKETPWLALCAWGRKSNLWTSRDYPCVYDLKGALSILLSRMGVENWNWEQSSLAPPFIHPGQFVKLKIDGQFVGYVGSLHPVYQDQYKIKEDIAFAEWNLSSFCLGKKRLFQSISRFPPMERDLAFWIPEDFPAGQLAKEIKKQAGPLCRSVEIFDLYRQNKENTLRSVAFRLLWQAEEKTLTESQIKTLQEQLIQKISKQWPVRLRSKN